MTRWHGREALRGFALFALVMGVLTAWGCNGGSGTSIPNISQAAAPLDQDGRSYNGPKLETARYGHSATTLADGQVLIAGGTDERHLTSLDSAEIFDQTAFDQPLPETISGAFIDTDFNGDPITLANGGRVYHTATLLPDGNVLVCGGSRDNLISNATGDAEIFDASSRTFDPDFLNINNEMIVPRFRHTAKLLATGRVLIVGGQRSVMETIIDDNFPPGHPLFQVDVETFPSTETIEVYVTSLREFQPAMDLSGNQVEMVTPRGRSNLGGVTVAGPDGILLTSDDIAVFSGGFQTLSALFAPQTKFPNQVGLDMQTGVEYYDPATGLHGSAPNVVTAPRSNDPILVNLGVFRSQSIDGVPGVNNMFLVTNGDDNGLCRTSNTNSEVVSVTFTGFGPAEGILFGLITGLAHDMNIELNVVDPMLFPVIGRSECPAVLMPTQRTYDGQTVTSNWVVTAGGAYMFCPPGGQAEEFFGFGTNEVLGFMLFDPFYAIDNITLPGDPPPAPWDQSTGRGVFLFGSDDLNPSGIIGTWLNHDSIVPDNDFEGFAGPLIFDDVVPLSALKFERAYHTMSPVPGEDGIINTFDERILFTGGGASIIQYGGEPVSQSSEVYLPIGANGLQP